MIKDAVQNGALLSEKWPFSAELRLSPVNFSFYSLNLVKIVRKLIPHLKSGYIGRIKLGI